MVLRRKCNGAKSTTEASDSRSKIPEARNKKGKKMRTYRDFDVFKRSYSAALEVHQFTLTFPQHERYELGRQMRTASKSISLNIAEGYAKRASANEFKRFLMMSIGSCEEMKVLLTFAKDLSYVKEDMYEKYLSEYEQIGKMLYVLHKNWQKF